MRRSRHTTFTMMESAVGTDWGPFFSTATWLLLCMSTLSRYQPAGTAGHEPEAIPLYPVDDSVVTRTQNETGVEDPSDPSAFSGCR